MAPRRCRFGIASDILVGFSRFSKHERNSDEKCRGRENLVCKPNSVFSAAFAAEEAAIYLSDLPITRTRRSGARSGQLHSTPEGMESVIYAVLHQVGFVLSRPPKRPGSLAGPAPLLTPRWSLTPPFHHSPVCSCEQNEDVCFL